MTAFGAWFAFWSVSSIFFAIVGNKDGSAEMLAIGSWIVLALSTLFEFLFLLFN